MAKLWGGRFEGGTHQDVEEFTNSLALDSRLLLSDLEGSRAHAEMLGAAEILSAPEAKTIVDGLDAIASSALEGTLAIPEGVEDIHSAIETLLTDKIGAVAGKLHTARSRNDQVATACRVYLKKEIQALDLELGNLQQFILGLSTKNVDTLIPGTTHLQHAQPVSLAHHLMAYFWMFSRDRERLQDCFKRVNSLPLGAGALAGTTLPLQRELVAKKLGFTRICENSLDAVSDRDFVVEFLSAAALIGSHLSRLAEELVIWSTPEFGFIEMADDVTTGSSLMPQKKNPDVAELLRGRTGRLQGALMGALTLLKSLPLSYNRDLQEDKFHLFQGLDSVRASVRITKLILEKTEWKTERMAKACEGDYSNATDLADYLVRKGVPFRETHEISGKAVRLALSRKVGLEDLPLSDLKSLHSEFEKDIFEHIQPRNVMARRNVRGGTGTTAVKEQIQTATKDWETKNAAFKV